MLPYYLCCLSLLLISFHSNDFISEQIHVGGPPPPSQQIHVGGPVDGIDKGKGKRENDPEEDIWLFFSAVAFFTICFLKFFTNGCSMIKVLSETVLQFLPSLPLFCKHQHQLLS